MKYILSIILVSLCSYASGQNEKWEIRNRSTGLYYSTINSSKLDNIIKTAGFPEFKWAPVGYAISGVMYKNNIDLLFSTGTTARSAEYSGLKLMTFNYYFDYSIGYRILDKEKISLTPFIGFKGLFNGYWINSDSTYSTLSGQLGSNINDYNFFSTDMNLILGSHIGIFKTKAGQDLLNIKFDISLVNFLSEYYRIGNSLNDKRLVKQSFFISIGFNFGE